MHNIVEADEDVFPRILPRAAPTASSGRHRGGSAAKRGLSAEQIPVLVVEDREGASLRCRRPQVDLPTISCLLAQVLAPDALLCSDGAASPRHGPPVQSWRMSRSMSRPVKYVRQQVFHVKHVNACDSAP
ncbi:MAG: hypothetical protein IPJ50_17155, partial [Betaproteobacteria bacterium]|nr:hypothetical protein [Betaproteobacteria bacterium]